MADHWSVPGRKMAAFSSKDVAEKYALAQVNDLLRETRLLSTTEDGGFEDESTGGPVFAETWEAAEIAIQAMQEYHYPLRESGPDVWIVDLPLDVGWDNE